MERVNLQLEANKEGIIDKMHTKGSYVDTKMVWDIKFGTPLNRGTVNSKNMFVVDKNNKPLKVAFNYDDETNTLKIRPLEEYKINTEYFLTVTTRVKGKDGRKFKENLVIKFNQVSIGNAVEEAQARIAERSTTLKPIHRSDRSEHAENSEHPEHTGIPGGPGGVQFGNKQDVIKKLSLEQKYTL